MKVSNRIYFSKIWVTIATKLHHTPFYIRPNNLPPGIFWNTTSGSRTWHRWLNDGKILKKSIGAFSRKLRVKFQGVKIQQKQSCFKCYCQLCPQDLTKWYSGLKMNLKTSLPQVKVSEKSLRLTFRNYGLNINWCRLFFCFLSKITPKILKLGGN